VREGWERTRIGDLLTIQNGFAFDSKSFSESKGVPLIRIRDLKDGQKTEAKYDGPFDKRYEVKSGDLLIGMDGEFGCYEWRGDKALLNQRVCRLEGFSGKLEPKFLFHGINKYLKEIEEATTYTTVKHLSSKQIANIEIPLPPPPEQQRIVAILDEAFAGLATATANAEKNLKNARELFESYLNSVFITKGEGWLEKRLEELGRLRTGTTPKTSEAGNLGNFIPFVKPGDFREDGSLDYENEGLSQKGLQSSRLIPADSAAMVCIGATIGKSGYVAHDVAANQQINTVSPNKGVSAKFLYYQMLTRCFQGAVRVNAGQATLPIISKSKWGALTMAVPPSFDEQQTIVSKLDELQAMSIISADVYRAKLAKIADLKQSILQKAFSGELTSPPSQAIKEAAE
jgi:type I restriction enzyme S subunit